jgi:DNA helicase-2/ATP-dependent DNA helicase PcrA
LTAPARFIPATLQPTDEQFDIQTAGDRTVVVQANAGAAKTTTLALRIGEALAQGVPPERILVLTYTRPACQAMAEALARLEVPAEPARRLRILTFEQFAEDILLGVEKQKVPRKPHPEDLAPFVMQAVHALDMDAEPDIVETFLQVSLRLKGSLRRDLLLWDGEAITPETAEDLVGVDPRLLRLFTAVEALRCPPGDGSDRPVFRGEFDATYDLARLLADPETDTPLHEMTRWPRDVEELLVDEMHDLNLAMFTILRALLQTRPSRFCGVGDFDQVVHQTAGAEQRFMDAGVDLGPSRRVRLYPLTATRRFGSSLAAMAGRLTDKKYASECGHKTQVACLGYDGSPGSSACEDAVVAEARRWQEAHAGNMAGFAVVLRHPHQSVPIENALLRGGFAYRTVGFNSYLLQPEVLLVRALLAVAAHDFSQLASESTRRKLVRAVVFFCGVRLSFLDSEGESPEQRLESAIGSVARDASLLDPFFEFQVMSRGEPAMVARLRAAIDIARRVQGPGMFAELLDALQMDRLVHHVFVERQRRADALAYMAGLRQAARQFQTAAGFFDSLNQAENQLATTASARNDARRATLLRKKTLTLATVVAVKGLEFEHVVMPRLAQGEFPARLSCSKTEERNLFYVGITRARERLTLLADRDHPSEFIAMSGVKMV